MAIFTDRPHFEGVDWPMGTLAVTVLFLSRPDGIIPAVVALAYLTTTARKIPWRRWSAHFLAEFFFSR